MKKYIIKLRHDNGTVSFIVIASSQDNAIKQVCNSENCPESAIYSIRECKTKITINQ